jgi:hypothetical protein
MCRATFRDHVLVLSRVKQSNLFDPRIWARLKSCKFDGPTVWTASNETDPFPETSVICCPHGLRTYRTWEDLGKLLCVGQAAALCSDQNVLILQQNGGEDPPRCTATYSGRQ